MDVVIKLFGFLFRVAIAVPLASLFLAGVVVFLATELFAGKRAVVGPSAGVDRATRDGDEFDLFFDEEAVQR